MAFDQPLHLDKDRHVKYWKRCSNLLPEPYTAGDASRMSLGFFIVAALDLLDVLESVISARQRQSWIDWVYSCQVPDGGFRGFTGTSLGGLRNPYNWHWDPANVPNTYFALSILLILGDDLGRVKRKECLAWLSRLQLQNGSFGEILGEDDHIEGGNDMRLCCCAAGIARILQSEDDGLEALAFDQTKMLQYIVNCQSHDGGFGQAPLLEAHSGLNYCAVAALSFLGAMKSPGIDATAMARQAGVSILSCTTWMLDRQTTWIDEDDLEDDGGEGGEERGGEHDGGKPETQQKRGLSMSSLQQHLPTENPIAGFNGRCGKVADTCYCFWNVGALAVSLHSSRHSDRIRPSLILPDLATTPVGPCVCDEKISSPEGGAFHRRIRQRTRRASGLVHGLDTKRVPHAD